MYKNEKSVVYIVTTDKELAPAQHGGTISKKIQKNSKKGKPEQFLFSGP